MNIIVPVAISAQAVYETMKGQGKTPEGNVGVVADTDGSSLSLVVLSYSLSYCIDHLADAETECHSTCHGPYCRFCGSVGYLEAWVTVGLPQRRGPYLRRIECSVCFGYDNECCNQVCPCCLQDYKYFAALPQTCTTLRRHRRPPYALGQPQAAQAATTGQQRAAGAKPATGGRSSIPATGGRSSSSSDSQALPATGGLGGRPHHGGRGGRGSADSSASDSSGNAQTWRWSRSGYYYWPSPSDNDEDTRRR